MTELEVLLIASVSSVCAMAMIVAGILWTTHLERKKL